MLERRSRTLADWKAALEGSLHGGYRSTALAAEQAALIAGDARASIEQRIDAAFAVSSSGDSKLIARVRIAAEAAADPALKLALMKALDGELQAGDRAAEANHERATTAR